VVVLDTKTGDLYSDIFDVDGWMQWDIVGDMIDGSGFERPHGATSLERW